LPNYDRTNLTRKIQGLTELTVDERSTLLELLNTRKKYGLVWEDKPEKVEDDLRSLFPVLTEVADRRIVGPEGSPNHVLIEGENLHALTALQYTHEGKVDVIYIDPPYNTGNKDFVYNDHFVDKEDQWRHSKWLSFVEKRLKLAKLLLKETGVIFVSIDDNEQAQLKLICDEIFGEDNLVANVIWQKMDSPSRNAESRTFSDYHEYILVFAKDIASARLNAESRESILDAYPLRLDDGRPARRRQLRKNGKSALRSDRPTMWYPLTAPDGSEVWPIAPEGWEGRWVLSQAEWDNRTELGLTEWIKRDYGWVPYYIEIAPESPTVPWSTLWTEVDQNRQAKAEITAILGLDVPFQTPKPVSLVKQAILIGTQKEGLILDFFAGSGTTLHATMALNAEDGGNRQCILVTNNENNICEEVTYERNRRVVNGYTNAKGVSVPGLANNSLRYYRTAFINRERSQKNRRDLTRASVDILCLKENSYAERPDLTTAERRVFEGSEYLVFVLFDPETIPATVELIAREPKHSKVYVFSPGAYAWDDDFEEVRFKTTLCALPEALIQAFQKVMPPEGRGLYTEESEAQE